jgi:hypothetical protein
LGPKKEEFHGLLVYLMASRETELRACALNTDRRNPRDARNKFTESSASLLILQRKG